MSYFADESFMMDSIDELGNALAEAENLLISQLKAIDLEALQEAICKPFDSLRSMLLDDPELDLAKIKSIQSQLAEGTYEANAQLIAMKMLGVC